MRRVSTNESIARWTLLVVIIALATGAVLRLIWPQDIEYKADEQWTFEHVQQALSGGPLPEIGMSTSIGAANPGLSIWIFIVLGKLFAVRTAPELATAVQLLNVAGIVGLVAFACCAASSRARELLCWAAALWAVNPLAIIFERKIWPPSVLPPFTVALIATWWYRSRPVAAFAWGALGATIGQIHLAAGFLALALLLWTLLHEPRTTHWPAWLLGNVLASLPAFPWALFVLQHPGSATLKPRLFPLLHNFLRWITQPFGFGAEYTLGSSDMRTYLAGPEIAGQSTYVMTIIHVIIFGLFLFVVFNAARTLWRRGGMRAHDLLVGDDNEAVLIRAAFWGYLGLLSLMTLLGADAHRHYLVAVAPVMALWLARLVFWCDWKPVGNPRAILTALCIAQAVAGAGLLDYIHVKQIIAGEYGPTWRSQQNSSPAPQ